MLDQSTRAAILKLNQQGHSIRGIARALHLSRGAVRDVLRSGTEIVPTLVREEKATAYRDQILELYPNFTRFECKVFLTDALQYFQGACKTCMIDNTHVVVLKGTGRDMVPVPEMAAFAERYGFHFRAHEKGDAQRSARVERNFRYIDTNFLAGRKFQDWEDANRQAREWCDKVNAKFRDDLKASPRELFAVEQPHLRPLPLWVPPVYLRSEEH